MNVDNQNWGQAVAFLGIDFTKFLFASTRIPEVAEFTVEEQQTAATILGALSGCDLNEWDLVRKMNFISTVFCSYNSQLGTSLATYLHIQSGGARPGDASSDRLEALLCTIAIDVYASFLVPKPPGSVSLSGAIYSHPARAEAESALFSADEPLMKLFPQANFSPDPEPGQGPDWQLRSQTLWNSGDIQSIQMIQIPETLLRKSCGVLEDGPLALKSYTASVRATLAIARTLAEGKAADVPVLAGCYSASLADDVHFIQLSQGRFRAKTAVDENLVSGSETVVLELPTKLSIVEHYDSGKDGADLPETSWQRARAYSAAFNRDIEERISLARMAVLLSSKDQEVLAIGQSFMTLVNPLASGHWHSMSPLAWPMAQFSSRPLRLSDEATIQGWYSLLEDMPKGLKTGRDRLLAAVSERHSPYDGFIDAVIAWENLFGAAGETGLRVCASLARLLQPNDAEARSQLYKKAKSMYDTRSRLVHGGQVSLSTEQATAYRNDAVEIAIQAWRSVLSSDALRNVNDSATRSNLVLLGS